MVDEEGALPNLNILEMNRPTIKTAQAKACAGMLKKYQVLLNNSKRFSLDAVMDRALFQQVKNA